VAVDPAGNAVAVWSRYDGANYIVQGATRPASGSWETPDDLSEAGENAQSPAVAVDNAGSAVAVWSGSDGGPTVIIQSAARPAGGPWLEPIDLSATGVSAAEAPRVAVDSAGNAAAVWERSNGSPTTVQATTRPAAGAWLEPIDLSEIGKSATEPQLALDPSGDGVAVWSRDNGSNTIVQSAGYDAVTPQLRFLSIPAAGTVRQPVSFTVSPFDAWSDIGSINWSFGDGAEGAGAAVTHTFMRPGLYTVHVVAADRLGNAGDATGAVTIFNKARAGHYGRLRRGRALLKLYCPSPAGCIGELRLIAGVRVRLHRRLVGKRRLIGQFTFSIPGPGPTTVAVRLTKQGKAALEHASSRGVKAQLTGPGIKHRVVILLPPRLPSSRNRAG
jgi:hypothetical protein